ncbi:MAG: elongation factor G [Myxococcota bacterium]|jgi:elongation factor G|nr:elongation factor G [Myxococcota bacterium]
MQNVQTGKTRNFALIGHSGDGKTTLGESLIHVAGVTETAGRVDDDSSALNYLPEERNGHTASVTSHVFAFDHSDYHFTLVDTPGDPNFQGDGKIALQALDAAVLLVSGVEGPKAGTEKMLRTAQQADMPIIAFVNELDREDADFDRTVEMLTELEIRPVPISFNIGKGDGLEGVVDLVHMEAVRLGVHGPIPDELKDEANLRRDTLVEAVAEATDDLLEAYLEEGNLGAEDLQRGLRAALRSRMIVPVVCGSALTEHGVTLLLEELEEFMPSPIERGEWLGADDEPNPIAPAEEAPFSAIVFKTIIDRYTGTLSVMRVVSGKVSADSHIMDATNGEKLRVGKLFLLQGEKHIEVSEAGPGDIVAVAKLKDVHTGHALTDEKGGVHLHELEIPGGVISYAIEAGSGKEDEKIFAALAKLEEEDPSLHVGRDDATGEFLLTGMGELHIRTTAKKLNRLFGLDIHLKTPKVPYRETISKRAEHVEGKLKKQTGGAGMFGVAYVDVEPLPRGEGFAFEDRVVGGAIPKGLIPAVEKGVREACQRGPLAGYPVVDITVKCVDGKYHAVDSNEMAFHLAGSFALKAAVQAAGPTLLEPFMTAEITAPEDHVGDVMGDIAGRRGLVQTTESRSHSCVIIAKVPMSEMLDYATALSSMTGGKGEFHLEYSHYSEVPAKLASKIIEESQVAPGEH